MDRMVGSNPYTASVLLHFTVGYYTVDTQTYLPQSTDLLDATGCKLDEGREKLWDGQEVFVRWKNNRHAVYFDGNVVLQEKEEEEEVGKDLNCEGNEICTDAGCIYTDDGVCVSKKGYNGGRGGGNYKVSVQYNDGDFERNVPLDLIFVKVF